MKKFYTYTTAIALSLLLASSCDSYLDINRDPNSPSEDVITNDMVLPAVERSLCSRYGGGLRVAGGYFAEYYSEFFGISIYLDTYNRFIISASQANSVYSGMATCIANATVVMDKAAQEEDWGTYLAANTIRVFAFQTLVDAYGEVPYTQAMDQGILNPAYDDGQTVYNGILAELDNALSKVSPSNTVATSLLYPDEKADKWIKFANALKLRILMRESGVASVDDKIAKLIQENNFPTEDVAFAGFWQDAGGKATPFYETDIKSYGGNIQHNCAMNLALYVTLKDCDDARLPAFFSKKDDRDYFGAVLGSNFSTNAAVYGADDFCLANVKFNTPQQLISMAETEFFIAEYYAKKGDSANAENHYKKAIESSFETVGLSASDAESVLEAWPYDQSNYAKCIGVQKWVALGGTNPFEGWCELRRLGYPAFGTVTGDDLYADISGAVVKNDLLVPGTLYTPIKCNPEIGKNALVQRFPYSLSSVSYNPNAPATKKLSEKVFWAK